MNEQVKMNREEILAALKTIIVENLEHSIPEDAGEDAKTLDDLNIDSIMMLQLIVYLEETFNVNVPDEEVDPAYFETLGSLVTFVEQLLDAKV
ncbi:phosphopantetheine-binding protein [Paenibacillus sp. NPDC058071]|uniref:phosphopantetheine-binding protein n=1 Tax=Paenibacillus sp. NPDC058071 TaxID=3346326 RepID=UPI0036DF753F